KRPDMIFSHTTPLLVDVNGKPQLLVSAHTQLQGVDPENGVVLWSCAHVGDVPTPAFARGLVYADEGRGNVGICVDASGTGDVTKTHLKWKTAAGINGFGSPLIVGERIYRVSATLRCWDLATGKEIWAERLGGDFNPSPIATPEGRIYFAGAGPSWVIQDGPKFELLGKSDLGEPSSASAAVSDGCLFLKGQRTLFCVGKK
ncbi:MAG: PQQ-binding-like beta-propeller repeat protein, partial [Planctomycetota bacterium]